MKNNKCNSIYYKCILFVASLFITHFANANCYTNQGGASLQNVYFSQPVVTVQRDAPIGSIIGAFNIPDAGTYASCAGGGKIYYEMVLFTTPSGIPNVYLTNVPGVGISVDQSGGAYPYQSPAFIRTIPGSQAVYAAGRAMKLVKVGPITSGIVNSGVIARNYSDDAITSYAINFTGSSVTQLACSINTPNITVPLDDVFANDLTSIGKTAKPKVFNVGLDCDTGAKINAKLTGTQNTDSSTEGVLQLSGAGGDNVASGVAIQILYNNAPMALNNNIVLKTSTGGQETFPFTAQYYQTKNNVTAGSANATATLELTYQ